MLTTQVPLTVIGDEVIIREALFNKDDYLSIQVPCEQDSSPAVSFSAGILGQTREPRKVDDVQVFNGPWMAVNVAVLLVLAYIVMVLDSDPPGWTAVALYGFVGAVGWTNLAILIKTQRTKRLARRRNPNFVG